MQDVLTRTPPPADVRLAYGSDPNQFGDLRLPKPEAGKDAAPNLVPAVLMIHGGYWRAKYDLMHAGHLCAALATAGIATFNLEYRRVGNAGGSWPGTFEDIRNGMRFLYEIAAKYKLDRRRIAVMGHSAGGQLALALAAHQPQMKAAIALAGVLDLQRAWELHLSNDAVVEFLGGTPEQVQEHYKEASPMLLTVPKIVRQVLIHGAKDEVVPPSFSRDYNARKEKTETVKLIEPPNAGHFELIDPEAKEWKTVLGAVKDALA